MMTQLQNSTTTDTMNGKFQKPTAAFVGASWIALLVGVGAYLTGLWNAHMALNEKGYYLAILLFSLFSAISLQKTVRDKLEGIPVTRIYYGLSWFSLAVSILLLTVGLWNASIELSEKGFYGISFLLSLFAAITSQKNIRDMALYPKEEMAVEMDEQDNGFTEEKIIPQ